MKKKLVKRIILATVVLVVVIPGVFVYRQYRADLSRAYRRVSSDGDDFNPLEPPNNGLQATATTAFFCV
jgi:hypothetical protein